MSWLVVSPAGAVIRVHESIGRRGLVAATGTSADAHGYGQAVVQELFPDVVPA